jgi:oxysterol-binding protein 1
MNQVAIP